MVFADLFQITRLEECQQITILKTDYNCPSSKAFAQYITVQVWFIDETWDGISFA
jgi:hypothetical protein